MPGKKEKSKKKRVSKKIYTKNKKGIKKAVKNGKSGKIRRGRKKQIKNDTDKAVIQPVQDDNPDLILKPVESIFELHSNTDNLVLNPNPIESILEISPKKDNPESTESNPKPIETADKNIWKDNPEVTQKKIVSSTAAMFFMMLILASLILFLLAGYKYPATENDIANNREFWIINGGKLDRGMFTQFYSSFIFTACVYLLGFYVNSTFIRYGLKSWTIFSIGIYMMFLYGLGKMGELTYNHELFGAFKDLILPGALIILAYASYRIFKELNGDAQDGS